MEKPLPRNKYLLDHLLDKIRGQQFNEGTAHLKVPRLTFMAMVLEAYNNKELDKRPFNHLLEQTRRNIITLDNDEDAYFLTEKSFFHGLLAYVPWKGTSNDCIIPQQFNVIIHRIETSLTLGANQWHPNNIEALAIEELSPGGREQLMHEYQAILKSVNFKE